MKPTNETDLKQWIYPKPKLFQKKSEIEAVRSLADTPMLTSSQRSQEPGARRKTITQDNAKTRSFSRFDPMERRPIDPDFDLHPQPCRRFSAEEASRVIKSVLEGELHNCSYDPTESQKKALQLAELVKMGVRELGYERYKLVCYVVLGPVSHGTISCCSRSIWSPTSDTYAEYLFQNQTLFALCIVYAGYYE